MNRVTRLRIVTTTLRLLFTTAFLASLALGVAPLPAAQAAGGPDHGDPLAPQAFATLTPIAPTLSISDAVGSEGCQGTTIITFTVTLNGSRPAGEVTVSFATVDDTAKARSATNFPGDYFAAGGQLRWLPGEPRTKTIAVQIVSDVRDTSAPPEPVDETFFVDLFNASSNVTIARARGTGSIMDMAFDDCFPPTMTPQS